MPSTSSPGHSNVPGIASAAAEEPRRERLPATIVTGFLGSGKTTLLNHILTSRHGLRVAVIVNEIGEIAIDNELIVATADDMVELGNGCICCSLNSDLVDAVFRVLERAPKVDYLILETTGLADPLPIVLTFLRSELRDRIRIDAVVAVADAESFAAELFDSKAARNQLRYADIVLLNKCDLAAAGRLDAVEGQIRALAPNANVVRTTGARIALPLILSVGLFESDRFSADRHDPGHDHLSFDGFAAVSFESGRPLAADAFQRFLEGLPANVFRGKGVLWLEESDNRHVFHLVGKRFTLDVGAWSGPRDNRLVLIGRGMNAAELRQAWQACAAAPAAVNRAPAAPSTARRASPP
jgi:G3E family GTPase